MSDICRVCLTIGDLVSLFEIRDSIQLSAKIMFCTSVQIAPDENLPVRICQPCIDRLNTSYDFKVQCENSDLNLRNKLYESQKCPNDLVVKVEDLGQINYDSPIKCEFEDSGFNNESAVLKYDVKKSECGDLIKLDLLNNRKSKRKNGLRKKESSKKRKCKLSSSDNDDIDIYDALDFAANNGNFIQTEKPSKTKIATSKIFKTTNKNIKEQCFTCGKVMSSRFRLKMHMRIHTGEKPFSCNYCSKTFALSQNLKVHMRVHTGEKPLLCGTCGKSFAQSSGLVAHQRLHTGETPYSCTLCPQSFRTFGHLQYHIRQHTGEKNFECPVCHRAFITRSDLTQHGKTHTGERPYVCTVCGMRMTRSSHLTRHMMTHSGEKPHRCTVCGSSYAQKADLMRHSKKHTTGSCTEDRPAANAVE